MAASTIYLAPPTGTPPNVIQIGNDCYRLVGDSPKSPDTASFDSSPPDCSVCAPVPCICPEGQSDTYIWTSNGDSTTLTRTSECEWDWNDGLGSAVERGMTRGRS